MVDERFDELLHTLCADYRVHNNLNLEARTNSNIKRGLRNDDGTGVMVGCTAVGNVLGYTIEDGERVPMPGRLIYRGYDLSDLVDGYIREQRFGFPEVAYLLLFGHLPDQEQRGLAAPVFSEEAQDLAALDSQVHAVVGNDLAKTLCDIDQFNFAVRLQSGHPFLHGFAGEFA